jgi:hypothetical protein
VDEVKIQSVVSSSMLPACPRTSTKYFEDPTNVVSSKKTHRNRKAHLDGERVLSKGRFTCCFPFQAAIEKTRYLKGKPNPPVTVQYICYKY